MVLATTRDLLTYQQNYLKGGATTSAANPLQEQHKQQTSGRSDCANSDDSHTATISMSIDTQQFKQSHLTTLSRAAGDDSHTALKRQRIECFDRALK